MCVCTVCVCVCVYVCVCMFVCTYIIYVCAYEGMLSVHMYPKTLHNYHSTGVWWVHYQSE